MGPRVQLTTYRKPRLGFPRASSNFASGNPEPFKLGHQICKFATVRPTFAKLATPLWGLPNMCCVEISERSDLYFHVFFSKTNFLMQWSNGGDSRSGRVSGKLCMLDPRLQLGSMCIPISTCLQISSSHGFLLVINNKRNCV